MYFYIKHGQRSAFIYVIHSYLSLIVVKFLAIKQASYIFYMPLEWGMQINTCFDVYSKRSDHCRGVCNWLSFSRVEIFRTL